MRQNKFGVMKRFRRPASHAVRRWAAPWFSSSPQPGAESLMADIMELNPGATVSFLSNFNTSELRAYRDRLTNVTHPSHIAVMS
ncbi:MAG: hypothetical protein H6815_12060 [Phycisphaeraceae bacterium]|nr:hypothetical protein [Phycisphaerales bacterium]MCB9861174.1 hypothetical protein [Phycisphaeraceae bacterium]